MTFLPPSDRDGLVRETIRLVGGCVLAILLLGLVVYLLI